VFFFWRRKLFHDLARVIVRALDVEGFSVLAEVELAIEGTITLDNRTGGGPAFVWTQTEPHREFNRTQNAPRILVGDLLHSLGTTIWKRPRLVAL
jgi:hypothetical protein